jgi:hypothetical protein
MNVLRDKPKVYARPACEEEEEEEQAVEEVV